ncbi:MAG: ABC transporter permease [Phycisphaerales bacterium]|nr:ABC transporter permease [Phycisphaerales bacterium]
MRRLLVAVPTLLGITLITFVLVNLAPGDPATSAAAQSDRGLTPEAHAKLRAQYGLDRPVIVRYGAWLSRVVRFDFGRSFHDGRSVRAKIAERLPPTLGLAMIALASAVVIAIAVGGHAAVHAGGWVDRFAGVACFALSSVPRYVMGMVLIVVVGVRWGLLPFMGISSTDAADMSAPERVFDLIKHGLLIGVCFVYPLAAYLTRFVRDNMAVVMASDYVRAARARGLSQGQVIVAHALPNALLPLLTVIGMLLPGVLGGAVILEVMFSWPGMGLLMYDAAMQRDYPVIMGLTVLTAAVVLLGTLIVDLLYAVIDPRVRYA